MNSLPALAGMLKTKLGRDWNHALKRTAIGRRRRKLRLRRTRIDLDWLGLSPAKRWVLGVCAQ